jgi:hypothetical protein
MNENEKQMVSEFMEIYSKFYKEDIGTDDARALAQNLLNVYKIVYRIPPEKAVLSIRQQRYDR